MADLLRCLSFCVVLSLFLTVGSCTWWNPYDWKFYWNKWAERSREQLRAEVKTDVFESKPSQTLNKDGINVCAVRIPISISRDCRSVPGRRRLRCRMKRYYVTKYKCCPGFDTEKGKPGCPKELYVSKENIVDVAKRLGLNRFVQLAIQAGVDSELTLNTKYTAFIPSDEAFQAIPQETLSDLKNQPAKLADLLLFHVVPGKFVQEELKHNSLLKTMDAPNKMRINECPERQVVIAQGGKIIKANEGASNGVIHVIDKVLQPSQGTLLEYLKGNPKMTIINKLIRDFNLGLMNVTLFAPTDGAFNAIPADRLQRLLGNKDCLLKVLKYHVIEKPKYSQLIESSRQSTPAKQSLDVISKDNGTTIYVNDAKITSRDVTTDDAIVHVIDKVLMPIGAMELIEAVKALNLTQFAKLLEKSKLLTELQENGTEFTVFAPTNEAFEGLSASTKNEIIADPDKLDMILKYHILNKKTWTYEFGRDKLVDAYNGRMLRLNSLRFGKVHAVNGACLKRANLATCNGVIHVINKVLTIPEGTVYDSLKKNPEYSNLVRIIDNSEMKSVFTNVNASLTLFAPTNRAFTRLLRGSPSTMVLLRNEPKEATQFLRAHLVNGTVYSCGLDCKYTYWSLFGSRYSVFSVSRDILRLRSQWDGSVYVNGIELDPVDDTASNGVIHGINKVIDWSPLALERRWGRRRKHHRTFDQWIDALLRQH